MLVITNQNTDKLIGQTFGRLTCLAKIGEFIEGKKSRSAFLFSCVCGRYHVSNSRDVKSGKVQSCGCLKAENAKLMGFANKKDETDYLAFQRYYRQYQSAAKRRGLAFSLSELEFKTLTSGNCHYCGATPSRSYARYWAKYGLPYECVGVDRKDNSIGYTSENSVGCCSICNHAKGTLGYDEFKNWAKKVTDYSANQNESKTS